MRKLKIGLNLFLFTTILFISSCKKSDDISSTSSVIEIKKSISKKWLITNEKSTNGFDYLWFEFNINNTFIIAKTDKTFLSGNYTLSDDAKTITLDDYGVLTINKVSDSEFAFSLKLNSYPNIVVFSATSAPITSSSTKTDLLCRTWDLVKEVDSDTSILYPNSDITKIDVIFSKYGTYFVTNVSNDGTEYLNRKWQWKDETETVICYGDTTCNCTDDNEVNIIELTSTSLKLEEKGSLFYLSPVKNTKSLQIINSTPFIKQKQNLFNLNTIWRE